MIIINRVDSGRFFLSIFQLLFRSKSVCNIIRTTSLHSGYNTRIPCNPQRTRLDDVEFIWEKRFVITLMTNIVFRCDIHQIILTTFYRTTVPLIGLLISTIAWWITLSSEEIRQTSIMRMPLLIAFTIGQSIAVGFISSAYAYSSVIKAMVTTAAATLSVTIYTLVQKNPKYDLSQWGRALSGLGMALL